MNTKRIGDAGEAKILSWVQGLGVRDAHQMPPGNLGYDHWSPSDRLMIEVKTGPSSGANYKAILAMLYAAERHNIKPCRMLLATECEPTPETNAGAKLFGAAARSFDKLFRLRTREELFKLFSFKEEPEQNLFGTVDWWAESIEGDFMEYATIPLLCRTFFEKNSALISIRYKYPHKQKDYIEEFLGPALDLPIKEYIGACKPPTNPRDDGAFAGRAGYVKMPYPREAAVYQEFLIRFGIPDSKGGRMLPPWENGFVVLNSRALALCLWQRGIGFIEPGPGERDFEEFEPPLFRELTYVE